MPRSFLIQSDVSTSVADSALFHEIGFKTHCLAGRRGCLARIGKIYNIHTAQPAGHTVCITVFLARMRMPIIPSMRLGLDWIWICVGGPPLIIPIYGKESPSRLTPNLCWVLNDIDHERNGENVLYGNEGYISEYNAPTEVRRELADLVGVGVNHV